MKIGLACVLFSFVALSVGSALNESLTYDEVFYREEGKRIVETRTFRDPYNPPLAPLLTGIAGKAGRLVTVGLGMLLIFAVYQAGGPVAAILLAFHPTLLAHSHYITNDVAVTFFIFLGYLAWRRYLVRASLSNAMQTGVALGFAFATKMTAIGYMAVIIVASRWVGKKSRTMSWLTVSIILLVLWAAYFFTWDTVIQERDDPGRVSVRVLAYAKEHNLPIISSVIFFLKEKPLPLGTYAATLKNNILRAGKLSNVFFDGVLYNRSQWYFMIINFLRKTPIPLLLLIGLGLWHQKNNKVRIMFTIGAGMILFASITGMAPLDRYVLPAIPFFVLVAAAPTSLKLRGVKGMIIVGLLLWYVVGTVAQYPHFISYANELVGPRDRRYEVLADSNLDWGQALPDLGRYVRVQKIGVVRFSYFGRDDENEWRFEEICEFHDKVFDPKLTRVVTVISVSNWYYCGYNKEEPYGKEYIWDVVADSLLVF